MPDDRTPAGPSEAAMAIAARYADTFDLQRELAATLDAFAARAVEAAVAKERARCLAWAVSSSLTQSTVIDGIESGREAP